MDFIHRGYSCSGMAPVWEATDQEVVPLAGVPQLPSDRSFVSRLLARALRRVASAVLEEQAMQFVTRLAWRPRPVAVPWRWCAAAPVAPKACCGRHRRCSNPRRVSAMWSVAAEALGSQPRAFLP